MVTIPLGGTLPDLWRGRAPARRRPPPRAPELWRCYKLGIDVANGRHNRREADGTAVPIDPEIDLLLVGPEEREPTFERLYEAEQRLARLLPDAEVQADLARRLVEAERVEVASVSVLRAAFEAASTPEARRAVYGALLDDLHFRYLRRSQDRATRSRTARLLILLGYALILPAIATLAWLLQKGDIRLLDQAHFVLVIWFGMIGAYLSRMIALQRVMTTIDHDTMVTEFSLWTVGVRLIVGTLGALIMYFLIIGNMVGGEIFPSWTATSPPQVGGGAAGDGTRPAAEALQLRKDLSYADVSREFAQLMIWSTLAGFSERLIPDRLAAMERRSQGQAPKP